MRGQKSVFQLLSLAWSGHNHTQTSVSRETCLWNFDVRSNQFLGWLPNLATMPPRPLILVLAMAVSCGFAENTSPEDRGEVYVNGRTVAIRLQSPVEGQKLPSGQDLVVKFFVEGHPGKSCRTLLLINDNLVGTLHTCQGSTLVDRDKLLPGNNTAQMVFQTEEDDAENKFLEPSVQFAVFERHPWSLQQDKKKQNYGRSCTSKDTDTCKKTPENQTECMHSVNNQCILHARPQDPDNPIPKIFHWVWVGGGGPIPAKFSHFMQSWRNYHPDWQFVVWTDELITVSKI
jgi:hypothetical protein